MFEDGDEVDSDHGDSQGPWSGLWPWLQWTRPPGAEQAQRTGLAAEGPAGLPPGRWAWAPCLPGEQGQPTGSLLGPGPGLQQAATSCPGCLPGGV